MWTDPAEHELVRRARALAPQIAACAADIETAGAPPADLIEALTDAGLFRLNIPAEANGEQADPLVVFHVIEALAAADASVAWVVMIAAEVSLLTGWLPGAVLSQMIGGDEPGGPRCRISGSSRVLARGRRHESGWLLSGQLNFLSGIEHAKFVVATFREERDPAGGQRDEQRGGTVRMALLPQRAGEVLRTWDTMGLRGTGSHDWLLDDAYVQAAHTWRVEDSPRAAGPAWRAPDRSVVAWIANAGHALGAAQGAIDDLRAASVETASSGDARPLAEREPFRLALAQAQARVWSARDFVRAAAGEAWQTLCADEPDRALLARWRLANVHAVHESVAAVEQLFRAAGTNAIHRQWPLERRLRDLQVARQHGAALDHNYDNAARAILNLPPRPPIPQFAPPPSSQREG